MALAFISLILALASISITLFRPCLLHLKPFCWVLARLAIANAIAWFIAAAIALLSVFFKPSGRAFSAERLTLLAKSSPTKAQMRI